jgi:exopolysaccharide production protein ExoZ
MLVYIQILRFVAATAVVAFHAWGVAPTFLAVPENAPSYGLEYAGHGVDLFFVISGFIIFYATQRSHLTPGMFLRRRIERIVPLYYFVIFVVVALAFSFPTPFGTPGWFTAAHILKSLAFVSFTDGEMPVVYLGWSLEYEMYFYLSAALLMALTREPWRNIVMLFSALAIIGQIPGVSGALGHYTFLTDPMVMEFVLGVLAGQWFLAGRIGRTELAATAAAFVALLIFDPASRVIVFGLPSALLVVGAAFISRRRPDPSKVEYALERLGDASYSIYLAQVNTVTLASQSIAELMPETPRMALIAIVTCVVVALGMLFNIIIERPLLKFFRHLGKPQAGTA